MSASDVLSTSMLVFSAFAFLVLLTIFIPLVRNADKTDEFEGLLEDESNGPPPSSKQTMKGKEQHPGQAWEKDADWWKE